jgi:hypothetical protein
VSLKAVQRSQAQSICAVAAYRHGISIADPRTGTVYNFEKKARNVDAHGIFGAEFLKFEEPKASKIEVSYPSTADDKIDNASQLWMLAELRERAFSRGRKTMPGQWIDNAVTGRHLVFELPKEANRNERIAICTAISDYLSREHLVAGSWVVHKPHKEGTKTNGNWHCHMTVTSRVVDERKPCGLGKKDGKLSLSLGVPNPHVIALRKQCADQINEFYKSKGLDKRVTHLSYIDQGLDREAQIHEGPKVTALERMAEKAAKKNGVEYVPVTDVRRENLGRIQRNKLRAEKEAVEAEIADAQKQEAEARAEAEILRKEKNDREREETDDRERAARTSRLAAGAARECDRAAQSNADVKQRIACASRELETMRKGLQVFARGLQLAAEWAAKAYRIFRSRAKVRRVGAGPILQRADRSANSEIQPYPQSVRSRKRSGGSPSTHFRAEMHRRGSRDGVVQIDDRERADTPKPERTTVLSLEEIDRAFENFNGPADGWNWLNKQIDCLSDGGRDYVKDALKEWEKSLQEPLTREEVDMKLAEIESPEQGWDWLEEVQNLSARGRRYVIEFLKKWEAKQCEPDYLSVAEVNRAIEGFSDVEDGWDWLSLNEARLSESAKIYTADWLRDWEDDIRKEAQIEGEDEGIKI